MANFVIVQNSLKTIYLFRKCYIEKLLKIGNVSVIAPNDDDISYFNLRKLGVKVYKIPEQKGFINKIKSILMMNFYILKERLNGSAFISHFLITFIISYFSLIPFNSRCIVYIEGLGSIFSKNEYLQKILAFILKNNNAIKLFCNEDEKNKIGSKSDIVTKGIGIDLELFKCKGGEKSNNNIFKLLYVGRLINDKGVSDAIEVFRQLKLEKYNVELCLVGDIYPNNPSSLTLNDIDNLKLEFDSSISFIGFTHDIIKWYEESDILLLPSIREGFPVCVMEASAMGIPVIGYDVPGMKDAVINGVNGYLSTFSDIQQLVNNTKKLLDSEILIDYKKSCSQYAKDNFSNIEKADFLVSLLEKVKYKNL